MTLAKAGANNTFIVEASLTIVTYDHQKNFLIQPTGQRFRSTQAQTVKMLIVAKSKKSMIHVGSTRVSDKRPLLA
jgi:hypothetical protein